jgi:hypothetical protein
MTILIVAAFVVSLFLFFPIRSIAWLRSLCCSRMGAWKEALKVKATDVKVEVDGRKVN